MAFVTIDESGASFIGSLSDMTRTRRTDEEGAISQNKIPLPMLDDFSASDRLSSKRL
jgi:hypothetical protein